MDALDDRVLLSTIHPHAMGRSQAEVLLKSSTTQIHTLSGSIDGSLTIDSGNANLSIVRAAQHFRSVEGFKIPRGSFFVIEDLFDDAGNESTVAAADFELENRNGIPTVFVILNANADPFDADHAVFNRTRMFFT